MNRIPAARVQDGTPYTGNGVLRYCAMCKCHKITGGGGRMAFVSGVKQWVCKEHKVNA